MDICHDILIPEYLNVKRDIKSKLLRSKYPDLREKYNNWLRELDCLDKLKKDLIQFNVLERTFNLEPYSNAVERVIEQETIVETARINYLFLEKMVCDYE